MQATPPPRPESAAQQQQNLRNERIREANERRSRNKARNGSHKQIRKFTRELDRIASKGLVVKSRQETSTAIDRQRQKDNPEFANPPFRDLFGYFVVLAALLGLVAINLILSRAALVHIIGLESAGFLVELFAVVAIPLAMMFFALRIAYARRDAEDLGFRGIGWLFASLILLLVTPLLSIALQLWISAGQFLITDWVLLAAKIALNFVAEVGILFGDDRLFNALGYWMFAVSQSRLRFKIWNQGRSRRSLEAKGMDRFQQIATTVDNYNALHAPDAIAAPPLSDVARVFINTIVDYDAIQRPTDANGNPIPPFVTPPTPPAPSAPAKPPTPTPPPPAPAAPHAPPPPPAADPAADAAENDYYRHLDERDIRRRERRVEP